MTCLRTTGRTLFAFNPLTASRYLDRHSVARKKPHAGDVRQVDLALYTIGRLHR